MVFPSLLPLAYIPALLQRVKQLFLSLYQPYLESLIDALSNRAAVITAGSRSALSILGDKIAEERWDLIFDRCLKNAEGSGGKRQTPLRVQPPRHAKIMAVNSGATSKSREAELF